MFLRAKHYHLHKTTVHAMHEKRELALSFSLAARNGHVLNPRLFGLFVSCIYL